MGPVSEVNCKYYNRGVGRNISREGGGGFLKGLFLH